MKEKHTETQQEGLISLLLKQVSFWMTNDPDDYTKELVVDNTNMKDY